MTVSSHCQHCGTKLPKQALGGLCPRCVGQRLFAAEVQVPPSSAPLTNDEFVGLKLGRYKLVQKLGEGGCGVVYAAEQEEPIRRTVALKVIKLGMDTRAVVARFEAERQALAMMDHPNIARVFDAGATSSGRPYFVMELVSGTRITEYCDQNQLTIKARIALFMIVCQAVQHAHQKGIIHRDLKPSNILVTEQDGVAVPKIIDFGIAKATEQPLTEATLVTEVNQFLGTPAYMSPEQVEMGGQDIDTRTDIYSLGVLLYELLTGTMPFDGEELRSAGPDEKRRIIREKEPERPSTRAAKELVAAEARRFNSPSLGTPGDERDIRASSPPFRRTKETIALLRGDLDWIVMKCLEKDRARRYETANALADDLRRHLADEPVTASAPTASYKLRKFARRNKVTFAVAALFTVVLLTATGISVWQAVRARQHLAASEKARSESEAIAQFLTEVFQSPDPAKDGRTVTVTETLGRAAKKVEADLADQPERRAKLQATLGGTYRTLGLYREAIALEEKVLGHHRAVSGDEHEKTLEAMHKLALSYDDATRWKEAFALREQIVHVRQKLLGSAHPKTLLAQSYLAWSNHLLNRTKTAVEMEEGVLASSRQINGSEHPDTILAMSYLGWFYSGAERFEDALKLQTEALALISQRVGREHPDTLNAMTVLAVSQYKTGHHDEAIQLQRELLTLSGKLKGPEHPETLWVMGNLAETYADAGRANEAIQMYQELLVLSREFNGPEHARTTWTMQKLAKTFDQLGRRDEAQQLRNELLLLRAKKSTLTPNNSP